MIMVVKLLWLVYDLGLDTDYEMLYTFLDTSGAKECGTGVAHFKEKYFEDLETLKKSMSDILDIEKNDRIYIIYKDPENKLHGKFLFGNRKKNPWTGYAVQEEEEEEETE